MSSKNIKVYLIQNLTYVSVSISYRKVENKYQLKYPQQPGLDHVPLYYV